MYLKKNKYKQKQMEVSRIKQMMAELHYEYDPLISYVQAIYERVVNDSTLTLEESLNDTAYRDPLTLEPRRDVLRSAKYSIRLEYFKKYLKTGIFFDFDIIDERIFKALSVALMIEEDLLSSFMGVVIAFDIFESELRKLINEHFGNDDYTIIINNEIVLDLYDYESTTSSTGKNKYPRELERYAREEIKRNPYGLLNDEKILKDEDADYYKHAMLFLLFNHPRHVPVKEMVCSYIA